MIISKRSQLNKLEKEKPLLPLIDDICSVEEAALPQKLDANLKWEKPTGDLLHWIRVLNLFDDIFARQISKYGLDAEIPNLAEIEPEDARLLVSCLRFTAMLLDHCLNRNIYSSSERIYQLIDTPTVDVKLAAFEVAVYLGERYVVSSLSKRYNVPKAVRLWALDVAKAFPPTVPASFVQKRLESKSDSESDRSDHYSLIDMLDPTVRHPSKWKALSFLYYNAKKADTKKSDTKKEKKKLQPKSEEGLLNFHLTEEQVRKMSLAQIYEKANDTLPKEALRSFSLAALSAKAFNSKLAEAMDLRAKLLRIKCWAIAFVSLVCNTDFTSANLFEAEPYTMSFLVDLISPENAHLVTNTTFYAVAKTLECISTRRVWGTELIRHLGGNVSHGLLYQVLRHINKKVKNQDDDCFEKGYLIIFTLLGNFVESKLLIPRLASGGLLNDLMAFLNVHTRFRWTCSAALNIIARFLIASPELIPDFANNNGFQLLIDTIDYEVQFALDNPEFGLPPKDIVVYYSISLRQVNYLKNLLKLVSSLVQSDAGDRLRNLFDSSILTSFNAIMKNPTVFGPLVLAAMLDDVLYIIHNEPTAFSILKEAQVIDTIFENYESLFMPHCELLMSLLEVLGAISLNKEGLKRVAESKALSVYFQSFYKIEYAKELMRADMSTSIGCSMDELGRHYPSLRPVIMVEIKSLIDNFPQFANQHLSAIRFYTSATHGSFYKSPEEEIISIEEGHEDIEVWEGIEGSNLVDNVFSFLSGLLQDSGQWGKECIREVSFESFQNFITLDNVPFDYTTTNGFMNAMSLIKYLDDEDNSYGFPKIFETLEKYLDLATIQRFIHHQGSTSYFYSFEELPSDADEQLKVFNVLNSLLYTMTEIYLNPILLANERYLALMNYLHGKKHVIEGLVLLLSKSITEEILIRTNLPDDVIANTVPILETPSDSVPLQVFGNNSTIDKSQEVHNSAKYKNTLQLRFMMYRLQYHTCLILSCISKSCMHRRQDWFSDEWRRRAVRATSQLAASLSHILLFGKHLSKDNAANYNLVALDAIRFIAATKDKGREILSTCFVSCLLESDDFNTFVLDCALEVFDDLIQTPKEKLAEVKDLTEVRNNSVSIKMALFKTILLWYARFFTPGCLIKLPFLHLFYCKDYCSDDGNIVSGIITRVSMLAIRLIASTLGSESKLYASDDFSIFESLPPIISERLIFLVRYLWTFQPVVDSFYPLNPMWMSPSSEQVKFLVENVGITTESAERILKTAKSIGNIKPRVSEDQNKDPEWELCASKLATLDSKPEKFVSPHSNAGYCERIKEIQLREKEHLFSSTLLKLCSFTKDVDRAIAQVLKDVSLNVSVYDTIIGEIEKLSIGESSSKFTRLARMISLLDTLICHDPFVTSSKYHDEKQAAFVRFLKFFVSAMSLQPELADTDYFVAGLTLIEPVLTQTPPSLLKGVRPYFPNLEATSEFKGQILTAISNFDPKNNIKAAVAISRFLYLFGKDEKFRCEVASSPVLKRIMQRMPDYFKDSDDQQLKLLQNMLILIHRVCFESTLSIENIITTELCKLFQKLQKKNLTRLLEENKFLLARDPELFIKIASDLLRIDNYDGESSTEIVYLLSPNARPEDDKSEDVEMKDSDEIPSAYSTGLIHLLLSQLMELAKNDWISSPEEQEVTEENSSKKKKDLRFESLLKNKFFGAMCFLLQNITELLGSYMEAKLEFITFSKKQIVEDKNKPRSTSLNFFLHQLIPSQQFANSGGPEYQRRETISSFSKLAILALVSTPVLPNDEEPDPKKENADMAIVRKFLVSIISKILKETVSSSSNSVNSYSKIYDLFDLCGCVLSMKFRELCYPLLSKSATKLDQYYVASAFIENQLPNQISTTISDLDLNFPLVHRVIKVGLKPLSNLAKIKLSYADLFESNGPAEKEEDEMEDIEDKEEIPDLFRNSTLGMYDIDLDSEEEDSYYDDGGPLDELMSGSDISEDSDNDDTTSDSDIDSDLDEDDSMIVDDDDDEGYDGDSADDIEIIDELDIHSSDESNSESDDEHLPEFYGFEGEGLSGDEFIEDNDDEEYNDAELDSWLEAFGEQGEGSRDDRLSRLHDRFSNDQDERSQLDDDSEVEFNGATEDESAFESELDDNGINDELTSRVTSDFVTSFFNALRPLSNQNDSPLFEGLVNFRGGNSNSRRSFLIVNSRVGGGILPRFDTAFEVILNDKHGVSGRNPIDTMMIRSTTERWEDAFSLFFQSYLNKLIDVARTRIVDEISESSYQLTMINSKILERIKKERQEQAKKRKEELRLKREEEAKQREIEQANNPPPPLREPVMVWIGDREVDISGTDIDPEFFEALPEDMRLEVFTQHVRERRANASMNDSEIREIDPDFLDALPDSIRNDILHLESMARRYSNADFGYSNEDEHNDGSDVEDSEGADSFTLDISNIFQSLASRRKEKEEEKPKKKTFASPLIDRAGIAGLVRLLFAPKPVNQRENIYQTLVQLCNNRTTRTEVMSLLIAVLYDGLHNQRCLEKVFGQVSARALNVKPQQVNIANTFPLGSTPVIVGVQVIEAVYYLLEKNSALRFYLLTEHENLFILKKNQRKNKQKDISPQEERYPINLLLSLLKNPLLEQEHFFVDLLANVLHFATRPLLVLRDKTKQHPPAFDSNFIPDKNLKLMIRILTSNECANTTFRRTISTMQHLSLLNDVQNVLSKELSEKATELGEKIIKDLRNLTSDLETSQDYSDNNKQIGKFTAASADQSKLLRILTALDYMFETTNKNIGDQEDLKEFDELRGLYKHLQLGMLWDALSDCLRVLEENSNLLSVATALLPLIEALMVVCKHSKVKELKIKDVMKYEARKVDFTKEPIGSLFFSFTDEHKKILNQMVRSNPNLMSGPFSMLVRNPKVLEFDNKKNYFDRQLHEHNTNNNKLSINVRRDQVFLDSYRSLFFKSVDEFRNSSLEVNFKGESGIDAGGVTREWYQVLSRQMFNPDYALFTAVASDETTFHPNRTSYINPEHLSFFKFIGRIIGKAIFDGCFLDCHFSRAVYKKILDRPVSLKDMENLDLEYFKSLMWMLENDITDIITEDFSVETDDYGEHKIIDLVPNGRNIPVIEDNKHEYVRLVVEYRLQTSVAEQMNNFIAGFHEIIPRDLIAIFDEQELELLVSGLPDIDVGDWQNNTTYNNYSPSSEQIQWFWRAVKSFDNEERAKLLQFATGTSKVPLNGFKELRGANGGCKFSIHRDYGTTDRLPSSHTCFNQIDLPAYDSYETLRGSLLLAITEGHEGFGLA